MSFGAVAGIAGAALAYQGTRKQANALQQAGQQLSTELPVYTGYGPGGISAGLGVNPYSGNFTWDQLINQNPYQLLQSQYPGLMTAQNVAGAMGGMSGPGQFLQQRALPADTSGYDNASPFVRLLADTAGIDLNTGTVGSSTAGGTATGTQSTDFGINLGQLEPSRYGLVNLAQQGIGRAGAAGSGLPGNVAQAAGALQGFGGPGDPNAPLLNAQIGQLFGQTGATQAQMARAGSPLTNLLQGATGLGALGGVAEASMGGEQARARQLDLLRQEAAPETQRQLQQFRENLFATGRGATTGGAQLAEAFARGLGQADVTRQLAAAGEGRAAQSQALSRAQGLTGLYTGTQGLEESLLQGAFGRFAQTQQLLGGLGSTQFQRNLGLNELGYGRAQQNLATQMQLAQFAPQLQSAYLAPAIQALQAQGGLQTQGLEPFGAALQLAQAQANARIGAGSNLAALTGSANFGAPSQTAANALLGIGERIAGGGGNNFLASAFGNPITAASYGTNPYSQQTSMLASQNNWF